METYSQQFLELFLVPPGSLIYHLVLIFSITAAIQALLVGKNYAGLKNSNRILLSLGLLLAGQLVLFLSNGLSWQGIIDHRLFLPSLDRAIAAFSILWISWIWCFPKPERLADVATVLLNGGIVIFLFISSIGWYNQNSILYFNDSWLDWIWGFFTLFIVLGGIAILLLRRPSGWLIGMIILSVNLIGVITHLALPKPEADYSVVIRLAHICSFPLLPTLAQRLYSSKPTVDFDQMPQSKTIDSALFPSWLQLAAETNPTKICKSLAQFVAQSTHADICLFVSLSNEQQKLLIECGFDQVNCRDINITELDQISVPVLANAIKANRLQWLAVDFNNSPDLSTLGKTIKINKPTDVLIIPINTSADKPGSIMLLSPYSKKVWSSEEQSILLSMTGTISKVLNRQDTITDDQSLVKRKDDEVSNLLQQLNQQQIEKQELNKKFKEMREDILFLSTQIELPEDTSTETKIVDTEEVQSKGDKVIHQWLEQVQNENSELTEEIDRLHKEKQALVEKLANLQDSQMSDENAADNLAQYNDDIEQLLNQIEVENQNLDNIFKAFQLENKNASAILDQIQSSNQKLFYIITSLTQQHIAIDDEIDQILMDLEVTEAIPPDDVSMSSADIATRQNLNNAPDLMFQGSPEQTSSKPDKTQPVNVNRESGADPGTTQEIKQKSGAVGQSAGQQTLSPGDQILNLQEEAISISNDLQTRYTHLRSALQNTFTFQDDAQQIVANTYGRQQLVRNSVTGIYAAHEESRDQLQQNLESEITAHQEAKNIIDGLNEKNIEIESELRGELDKNTKEINHFQSELRLALEEVARLESTLTDAQLKLQAVEEQLNNKTLSAQEANKKISSLAQEIHQPVVSINGYIELILSETVGILGAVQQRFMERIKASTEHLNKLLSDLADVTAVEGDAQDISLQQVFLDAIVDHAVAEMLPVLDEQSITLQTDLAEDLPSINVERDAIQQVVVNLLENAAHATPENGVIQIQARTDHQQPDLILKIIDAGEGISAEELPGIFAEEEGKDISLSVAKTLVEAQGGEIWIESEVGKGTTINVKLPTQT